MHTTGGPPIRSSHRSKTVRATQRLQTTLSWKTTHSLAKYLKRVLDQATLLSGDIIYIRDLNCDILHPLHNNKHGKCPLDICDVYDLDPLVNKPTSMNIGEKIHLFTCHPYKCPGLHERLRCYRNWFERSLPRLYRAKHKAIAIQQICQSIFKRSLKNFDQTAFLDDLSEAACLWRSGWSILVLGETFQPSAWRSRPY